MVAEVQNIENQNTSIDQLMPHWRLEWHDPRTLLTDKNSREITPDAKMVKSVAKVGVLQPIIAVRTAEGESQFWVRDGDGVAQPQVVDGQTRVRYGEGRTRASIDAARDLVPVIVTGPEGDSEAEEIARLIRQRDENTYRQGMTAREHANTAYQLSLYGVAEAEIAEELQIPRSEVRAAKKINRSKTGVTLLDEHEGLDLLTAAKIAEFEDHPQRVSTLLGYVANGKLHEINSVIRDWRTRDKIEAERAKVQAELESEGLRVTSRYVGWDRLAPVRYVTDLRDENGEPISAEQHANCPGHAMKIEDVSFYAKADGTLTRDKSELPQDEQTDAKPSVQKLAGVAVCDNARELHISPQRPDQTEDEQVSEAELEAKEAEKKEAARIERRRVIAGNKEWDAAMPERRDWVQKELVKRKTPPRGAVEFLTGELLLAQYAIVDGFRYGHPLAADWLGVEAGNEAQPAWEMRPATRRDATRKQTEGVTDNRRMVLLLTLVLAANEAALSRTSWRSDEGCPQRAYLRFLIEQGYPACTVERLAAGLPPLPGADEESAPDDDEHHDGSPQAADSDDEESAEDAAA